MSIFEKFAQQVTLYAFIGIFLLVILIPVGIVLIGWVFVIDDFGWSQWPLWIQILALICGIIYLFFDFWLSCKICNNDRSKKK
jgi:hypothetical protein